MSDPHKDDPLPPGWFRGYSSSQQRHFYSHKDTKHTQWHFPTATEAKDPQKAKERAEMNKQREQNKRSFGSAERSSVKRPKKAPVTSASSTSADDLLDLADSTSVAIIVPYRDLHVEQKRAAHLSEFVPHMHKFFAKLKAKGLVSDYHVYIIEQSNDERKFNRGKLLNIGFDLARKSKRGHDVFIFHDVDLLPQDDLGEWYAKFPRTPLHIARVWERYSNNPKYFGGVVCFSSADYKRINGYPNTFWGWGGEDDEMAKRLEKLGIRFDSPASGTLVDLEQMSLTEKLEFLRQHKEWKCQEKWEALEEHDKTWKINGLNNLKYALVESQLMDSTSRATKATVDVQLNGDHWSNEKSGVDYKYAPKKG